MNFPNLGRSDLVYQTNDPLPIPGLESEGSMLEKSVNGIICSMPVSVFSYLTKFFARSSIRPKSNFDKITLYRLAKNSQIISSLINAAKNGRVTVQIELQARFDEASNISYAEQMQLEGIELILELKALANMCYRKNGTG
jgi:polyphosphate kinase